MEEKLQFMESQFNILTEQYEAGRPGIAEELLEQLAVEIKGTKEILSDLTNPDIGEGTVLSRAKYDGASPFNFSGRVKNHREEYMLLEAQKKEISNV